MSASHYIHSMNTEVRSIFVAPQVAITELISNPNLDDDHKKFLSYVYDYFDVIDWDISNTVRHNLMSFVLIFRSVAFAKQHDLILYERLNLEVKYFFSQTEFYLLGRDDLGTYVSEVSTESDEDVPGTEQYVNKYSDEKMDSLMKALNRIISAYQIDPTAFRHMDPSARDTGYLYWMVRITAFLLTKPANAVTEIVAILNDLPRRNLGFSLGKLMDANLRLESMAVERDGHAITDAEMREILEFVDSVSRGL